MQWWLRLPGMSDWPYLGFVPVSSICRVIDIAWLGTTAVRVRSPGAFSFLLKTDSECIGRKIDSHILKHVRLLPDKPPEHAFGTVTQFLKTLPHHPHSTILAQCDFYLLWLCGEAVSSECCKFLICIFQFFQKRWIYSVIFGRRYR
jgi:hypothetical protein